MITIPPDPADVERRRANSLGIPDVRHCALVLRSTTSDPVVEEIAMPTAGPGSVVVKVLSAGVLSYVNDVYRNSNPRGYAYPLPLVPGTSAIGRIHQIGPDTTAVGKGDLVLLDSYFRVRDNSRLGYLAGLHEGYTSETVKLMRGEWRDAGTFAEFVKWPLENIVRLDEGALLGKIENGGLEYQAKDLNAISALAVGESAQVFSALHNVSLYANQQPAGYGGLRAISLLAGETIIIVPATGPFGSSAVHLALSLGARVLAMGRNQDKLSRLCNEYTSVYKHGPPRLIPIPITGSAEADIAALKSAAGSHHAIDCFLDITPAAAAASTHYRSAIMALRVGGRVALMGGMREDLALPHGRIMHFGITLSGQWMFSAEQLRELVRMVEVGIVELKRGTVESFKLEEWKEAFDEAEKGAGDGRRVVIEPWKGKDEDAEMSVS